MPPAEEVREALQNIEIITRECVTNENSPPDVTCSRETFQRCETELNEESMDESSEELSSSFPLELWESVFSFVCDPRDLKSLCLVNKYFHTIAVKRLWYRPKLHPFTYEQFVAHICTMPIRVLDTGKLSHRPWPEDLLQEEHQVTEEFFRKIGTLKQLKSLRFGGKLLLSKRLFSTLHGLENLTTFNIAYHPRYINYSDFVEGLAECLPHFKKLKEFVIIIRINRTEGGVRIKDLIDAVVKAENLEILTFMLSLDDPVHEFIDSVAKLKHLKILHVRLNALFRFEGTPWEARVRRSCEVYRKCRLAVGKVTKVCITF
jgi:hypothetical protein